MAQKQNISSLSNDSLNCLEIDLNSYPFNWWKNKVNFPCLTEMAIKFLSCPPSSVESECLFSIGGNIITNLRSSLKADTSEKLIFLN